MTVEQYADRLKNNLPKSWKRFVNQRLIEHSDNKVPEHFKCYDVQYWNAVYSVLANENICKRTNK